VGCGPGSYFKPVDLREAMEEEKIKAVIIFGEDHFMPHRTSS